MTRPTAAVLVRRVPDPGKLQLDRKTGRLLTEDVPFVLNPADRSALELALRLKDGHSWRVVAVAIDEPAADFELREAVAMGADEALLLADERVVGSDPTLHAELFKEVVEDIVKPDVVFASARSVDHSWSTVGPQLAAIKDWPLVIEASSIELDGQSIVCDAHTGAQHARVQAPLPCVVTVARHAVEARHATSWGVSAAFDDPEAVRVITLDDLELDEERRDYQRARTHATRLTLEGPERRGHPWEGPPEDVARIVARRLVDMGYAWRRS